MTTLPRNDEIIEVLVKVSRKLIEETLISALTIEGNAGERRLRQAKALLFGRQTRSTCFRGISFYDPNWEIILQLYVATKEGRQLSISQLCSLSGASSTTAFRYIEHLEALGFISRGIDLKDRRRANVSMLEPLSEAMDLWLDRQHAAFRIGA